MNEKLVEINENQELFLSTEEGKGEEGGCSVNIMAYMINRINWCGCNLKFGQ